MRTNKISKLSLLKNSISILHDIYMTEDIELNYIMKFYEINQSFTELAVQNQTNTHGQMCISHNNLIQYLMQNNLVVVDVPADGHCLLHAFQLALARKDYRVQLNEIKNRIIEYVEANIYEFTNFVTNSPNRNISSSQTLTNEINSYIYQKNYTRNSVDIVVQVLADIFSVGIKIIQTTDDMSFQIVPIIPKSSIVLNF